MKPHPAPDAQDGAHDPDTVRSILHHLLRVAKYGGLAFAHHVDINIALIDGAGAPFSVITGMSVAERRGWLVSIRDPELAGAYRCVLTETGYAQLARYDAELFGGAL